jgi:hypothetical protein
MHPQHSSHSSASPCVTPSRQVRRLHPELTLDPLVVRVRHEQTLADPTACRLQLLHPDALLRLDGRGLRFRSTVYDARPRGSPPIKFFVEASVLVTNDPPAHAFEVRAVQPASRKGLSGDVAGNAWAESGWGA